MHFAIALLFASSGLWASQQKVLPTERSSHTMVLRQVYLNGKGPFRMMVDTGATSCSVRPEIAAHLGANADYQVDQITASGSTRTAAMHVQVRVDDISDESVEVLVSNVAITGVDGVLGQTWLSRHSYLLDFHNLRFVLDSEPPEHGLRMGLRWADGRPGISARVDGVAQDLIIDSGAAALVLFRPRKGIDRTNLITNQGSVAATLGTAIVQIGQGFKRSIRTAELDQPYAVGLLPASAFRSVYVSNRSGLIVLVPR